MAKNKVVKNDKGFEESLWDSAKLISGELCISKSEGQLNGIIN